MVNFIQLLAVTSGHFGHAAGHLVRVVARENRIPKSKNQKPKTQYLVHDVPGEHQGPRGEGPGVELVQRQYPRELLQEIFLQQRDLNIA